MNTIVRIAAVVSAAASLSACATVTRGTTTPWEVKTEPSGAAVKTSNGYKCSPTPCAIEMPRKATFTATITKEGYQPVDVVVSNKIAGSGAAGLAGNVLIGGVIGVGVDAVTGAALDLTPNPAVVRLEPVSAVADTAPAASPVAAAAPAAEASPAPTAQPGA